MHQGHRTFNAVLKIKPDVLDATGGLARHISRPDRTISRGELSARLGAERQDVASLNIWPWIVAEVRKKPDEALPLATRPNNSHPEAQRSWTRLAGSNTGVGHTRRPKNRWCGDEKARTMARFATTWA